MVQQAPVGLAYVARLRTYPAQVATVAAVVPDEALGLQLADHAVGLGPFVVGSAVYLARLVGTAIPAVAAIGTVEPHLEDVAVVRQQLTQLIAEVGDILRPSVVLMVTVPGRQVDGELQPLLSASIGQLPHHIAPTLFPRRVLHGVLGICAGPHAKTAVVLGGKDDAPHARLLTDAHPLPTVQIAGIKQLRVFIAEAPLLVGVSVQRVMDKSVHLHLLPPQLVLRRHGAARSRRLRHYRAK